MEPGRFRKKLVLGGLRIEKRVIMNNQQSLRIGIGLLGYSGVGKAHINALKKVGYIFWPAPTDISLVSLAGRDEARVQEARHRYGFSKTVTDWRQLVNDDEVDLLINCTPNQLHAEPCVTAVRNDKHVLCEKPLARNAIEAETMFEEALKAGVKHMVSFNYRFIPAVLLARELISNGELGTLYHFRARYCDDSLLNPNALFSWRQDVRLAGSGAVGDLGAHIIDLARFLVGEPTCVTARTRTFIHERPGAAEHTEQHRVSVDDAFEAVFEFHNGAFGTLEASTFCAGRKNFLYFEVNGSKGTLEFNLERLNELRVYIRKETASVIDGIRDVLVTDTSHPYGGRWWPPGHILGWEHTFVHQLHHMLQAIAYDEEIGPLGATFEDGYRNAIICDALLKSAETGQAITIAY